MDEEQLRARLKEDIRQIIQQAPDLADLCCNTILDMLVGAYGRTWLTENFQYLRKCVKDILVEGVDESEIEQSVAPILQDALQSP